MKLKLNLTTLAIGVLLFNTAQAQNKIKASGPWPVVEKQMKPWTRWWWMGSAVDERNLNKVLTEYQQAGIGGVEITPIYGAVGFEKRYIDFLSPRWVEMLRYTVQKSNTLGMGVDMNTGTGWPFGGPMVKPEDAATKLIVQQYELKPGQKLTEAIKVKEARQNVAKLQAVTAYGSNGEVLDLFNKVDAGGILNWTAGDGNWTLYAAFSGKTRQEVKRAAPGGQGLTVDHLDKTAVTNYLSRFDNAFGNKSQGVRAFFNDSYEVYGANWTPTFFDEFKKNRGYDLKQHLRELVGKDSTTEHIARLKSDYRETMSDLLLFNFTHNWTDWSHKYGSITRNQSHGSPGNLLDLYGAVDIPETETFGSSYFPIPGLRRDSADIRNVDPDPMMCKFASSAAHTGAKNLISSETFTWLSEHFKTSYSQCKPEAEQLFLSGVNHIVYHGTTNSPEDAVWPGWLFYASAEFNPNNSLWPQINGLSTYLTRCQSVLQSGKADNELLIYWPIYDVWNRAKGMDMAIKVHNIDEWLHPTAFYKLSKKMAESGYSFDFASDRLLGQSVVQNGLVSTEPKATPYKVLIIPECTLISLETINKAIQLANEGATVIFQQLPKDVPGLNKLEERRSELKAILAKLNFSDAGNGVKQFKTGKGVVLLASDVEKALAYKAVHREELTDTGLQFIRRSFNGGKYYYIVNHTAKDLDTDLPLNEKGTVLIMDPQSGASGKAATSNAGGQFKMRLQIKSGEAMILKVVEKEPIAMVSWAYLGKPGKEIELTNAWSLSFTSGGPELPAAQKLDKLVSWTSLSDPKLQRFSGTGVYTSSFTLKEKAAREYVLNLNQVDESARVWINGQEVGILWSIPFQARVGKYLKAGTNTIKIEVVNLMANRIHYMDQQKIQWRNYHEINFVNINYKPFDASNWLVMPSGLIGPVTISSYF
ncbi:MAG: glycosyl hydrolase [Candidatus Pedobacter colombiensis]|uniref:Glycosyl hydrolase n=1 Tax=Candidatus Pedobacter colombiensis TaxID=3121371 RepID=A0AAJ5W926_9SPHI|nr:glycosyl hydrolase [Pedobacter sp.]WEK20169.1 MAG: glycosyl hydrolase [Pedobacter sp.]